jgi:transposase
MAESMKEKVYCVLEHAKTSSVTIVQRHFWTKFAKEAPHRHNIKRWVKQFEETGCLCRGKSTGRPSVNNEVVENIRATYIRSLRKSMYRASRELNVPQATVWRVLRKCLQFKPYKFQMVQALKPTDRPKRRQFCVDLQERLEMDGFKDRLVFTDEATFHLCGKIYLDMLSKWLLPQLEEEVPDFILQQDSAPPHWNKHIRDHLNKQLQQRWIGRAGPNDVPLMFWPPRSPDLTPCDFFFWWYVKEKVFVPPLPQNLQQLRQRIRDAVDSIDQDLLA